MAISKNEENRNNWVRKALTNIPSGFRTLDAGAGDLRYKQFCGHLRYVSQDFAGYDGKGDGAALQTGKRSNATLDIIGDITNIPEPDESFDSVMCIEVLEHVPHPVAALKELSRLLKPGGILILTAPFCALTHYAPYFYQTGFSRYFYEYWLKELGFEIVEMQWNGNYFEYIAQELLRLPSIGKKYSSDRPNWIERKAITYVLGFLERLSGRDKGSQELLAFGLHIRALKI